MTVDNQEERIVIFGMSRDLVAKGYRLFPIHPVAEEIDGIKCFKGIDVLPEKVEGAVLVVPPDKRYECCKRTISKGNKDGLVATAGCGVCRGGSIL